jgi:hypothetical protein
MFLRHREQAHARRKAKSKDRSLRQLLQLDRVPPQEQVGCQAVIASRLTPTEKQNQKIAAFGSSQLDRVPPQEQVGCQAAFASRLAPTKSKSKAKQRSCPRRSRPTQQ